MLTNVRLGIGIDFKAVQIGCHDGLDRFLNLGYTAGHNSVLHVISLQKVPVSLIFCVQHTHLSLYGTAEIYLIIFIIYVCMLHIPLRYMIIQYQN